MSPAKEASDRIAVTAAIGASGIYMQTGGRGKLEWEKAASRFIELLAPCRDVAREGGIRSDRRYRLNRGQRNLHADWGPGKARVGKGREPVHRTTRPLQGCRPRRRHQIGSPLPPQSGPAESTCRLGAGESSSGKRPRAGS